MPEIEVNIEIYCAKCGAGICGNATATRTFTRQEPSFRIDPCEKCLQDEYDRGYDDGYDQSGVENANDR